MKSKRFIDRYKKILVVASMIMAFACMSGCAELENTKVVLTAGFSGDELFRIEDMTCTKAEYMVYLVNMQNSYIKGFGKDILNVSAGTLTMEESIKENCLSTIAQIKAMNLLAQNSGIELTEAEKNEAQAAGEEYYSSLNDDEIAVMGAISKEQIITLYEEYATADKLYEYIIRDINPEISDDEARTITVQQIVRNTWQLDSKGDKVAIGEKEKEAVYNTSAQILRQLHEGADFDVLIEQYNEADEGTLSFGKGEVDKTLEDAAFNLDNGEISGIIETNDAYVILKCVSTFNREETEANKVRIVEQRKREVFGEQYDAFVEDLSRILNTDLWNKIKLEPADSVTTTSFFDIYKKHFGE